MFVNMVLTPLLGLWTFPPHNSPAGVQQTTPKSQGQHVQRFIKCHRESTHPPFVLMHLKCTFSKGSTLFFPPFSKAPGTSISTEKMPVPAAPAKATVATIPPDGGCLHSLIQLPWSPSFSEMLLRPPEAGTQPGSAGRQPCAVRSHP